MLAARLVPAGRRVCTNSVVRIGALAALDPIVHADLADGAQSFVIKSRYSERCQQILIEFAKIRKVLRQRRELDPFIGEQKFLIAGIPEARELPLQHNSGDDGHLILAIGALAEFRAATILFHANNAARAPNGEPKRGK